jgi:hypothetical protein
MATRDAPTDPVRPRAKSAAEAIAVPAETVPFVAA